LTAEARTYKRQAAAEALKHVEPGMILGLGSGSTAAEFVKLLGERIKREPIDLRCVATSEETRRLAEAVGIAIIGFDSVTVIDLTVDGADEIDPQLNLIKGGGGALLREKIVAMSSDRVYIIADESKLVSQLGAFALPVEVVEFGLAATIAMIETAAADADCTGTLTIRSTASGDRFRTDSGHLIVDCGFGEIPDPELLADMLDIIPGVVEHGLFIGIADEAYIAGPSGVKIIAAGGQA
jgi:ribose 5-phosphate isomerase A